jgi:hypothetical protein
MIDMETHLKNTSLYDYFSKDLSAATYAPPNQAPLNILNMVLNSLMPVTQNLIDRVKALEDKIKALESHTESLKDIREG